MSSIANSPDALAAIRQRKRSVEKKLKASRTQMTDNVSYLTGGPLPKTAGRMQSIGRIISTALVAYQGFRFVSGFVSGFNSLFKPTKRRR